MGGEGKGGGVSLPSTRLVLAPRLIFSWYMGGIKLVLEFSIDTWQLFMKEGSLSCFVLFCFVI